MKMPLLAPESGPDNGTNRGREKRNMTLNTKLTETEFAQVSTYCQSRQVAPAEWLRELVFRELRGGTKHTKTDELILGELVGIRLAFINLVRPRTAEEGALTPELFDSILKKIKVLKDEVAQKMLAKSEALVEVSDEHAVG